MPRRPPPSAYAKIYYNPEHPASFRGPRALHKAVEGSTFDDAVEWLQTQDTYTLFRNARRHLTKDPILVSGIDSQWEADLVDVQPIASLNKGNRYLLTVIDTLSKFAWVVPVKDKTGSTISEAFKRIFKTGRKPRNLRCDSGREFTNAVFQNLLKKEKVHFFTAKNRTKAAVVERFNRTLRSKLEKYFHATNKQRYIDVLPDLVKGYNQAVHSSIKTTPESVNEFNAEKVWRRLYGHLLNKNPRKKSKRNPLKTGDLVRISKEKKHFEKGYKSNWVEEVFTISKVIGGKIGQVRYQVKDADGEVIIGTFKPEELQKIQTGKSREVKKIVKYTPQEKAVTWRGYPDQLVTWMPRQ